MKCFFFSVYQPDLLFIFIFFVGLPMMRGRGMMGRGGPIRGPVPPFFKQGP